MIDYEIIDKSIKHYASAGFKRIESPWTVAPTISGITKPPEAKDFSIAEKNKVLVASGEQSFLYLYNKDFLPKGKFQTVTPCFRDEVFTPLHTKYFIKNELIVTDDTSLDSLRKVVHIARHFFRSYCLRPKAEDYVSATNEKDDVLIVDTCNGRNQIVDDVDVTDSYSYPQYDLVYRGIELGSYGIRRCSYLTWIYGTGVAEPRLSRALQQYGVSL